jgi:hypothetical protein
MNSCTDCPVGKYASVSGSLDCGLCGAGKSSVVAGLSCTECVPGQYVADGSDPVGCK